MEEIRKGRYKHYKGKEYYVIGIASHSETKEKLVVYKELYGKGKLWVRPLEMFLGKVNINNKKAPRFTYIGEK